MTELPLLLSEAPLCQRLEVRRAGYHLGRIREDLEKRLSCGNEKSFIRAFNQKSRNLIFLLANVSGLPGVPDFVSNKLLRKQV